jgi:hypothetical protein
MRSVGAVCDAHIDACAALNERAMTRTVADVDRVGVSSAAYHVVSAWTTTTSPAQAAPGH